MSAAGQVLASGNGVIPVSRSFSAELASRSWIQVASAGERVICERSATEPLQQVCGERCLFFGSFGLSRPRHSMITTGYSWRRPFSPYGFAARPALGCAPFQLIFTRSRLRRFCVRSTVTVTLCEGKENVVPSSLVNVRVSVLVPVHEESCGPFDPDADALPDDGSACATVPTRAPTVDKTTATTSAAA